MEHSFSAYPWSNQREISAQMTLQHLTNYVFMLPCGNKRTRTTVSSPTLKPLSTSWHCNVYITLTWAAEVKVWARTWLFESHFNTWGCIIWCALVYCQWLVVHWRCQSKLLQQNWNKTIIIIITILYGILYESQCYLVQWSKGTLISCLKWDLKPWTSAYQDNASSTELLK